MFKSRSLFVLAVAASFFIFQLFLFAKSFPAEYNLYLRFLDRLQTSDPFWTSFWFASELVGEVGLAIRFCGACFFISFAWQLFRKKQFALSHLRKAVLFEGAYYLFNLPFIVSLFTRPNTTTVNMEAGFSYALQILLVSPAFFMLYAKMKKPKIDMVQIFKSGAIAVVTFTFALWAKHFFLNLYALPISLDDPVLFFGFLNSALMMLVAGLILTVAFLRVIKKNQTSFSSKAVGTAFVLVGAYFIIYIIVSLLNQRYLSFLVLTELWAIAFVILGIGYIIGKDGK